MSSTAADVNDFADDEEGLSGFTILAIGATVIVVFFLVIWYAYQQGKASRAANETLPIVAADPRPVAEDVPQDASRGSSTQEVYDRMNGTLTTETVTAETPSEDALAGYAGAPNVMTRNTDPDPVRVEGTPAEVAGLSRSSGTTPSATQGSERTVTPPSRKPNTGGTATPAREPVRVAQTPAQAPVRSTTPAAATGAIAAGTHVVQVGAFDSNAAALDYFDGLSTRLGTMVSAKLPDIQVADVNGRTYHRLRIGPFTSKAEADRYCADLKTRKQDCLVRGV